MKFRWTVILSIAAHIGLFSLVYLKPADGLKAGMTYYVDLVNMPGGGDGRPPGGGRPGASVKGSSEAGQKPPAAGGSVKDLTVGQKPVESSLRFPDEKKKSPTAQKPKKQSAKEQKKEKMVAVVARKDRSKDSPKPSAEGESAVRDGDPFLRIGIGEGDGSGEGSGSGQGLGFGPGGPGGGYNYYYGALQSKLKNAWFNTAMAASEGGQIAYVACRIHRSGQASDIRIYQSSGNEALDRSGLRAVHRAQPFPPIPSGNPNQYIDVIFEFVGRKR